MNSWLTNYQKERDLSPGHTFDIPSIASSIDSFSESMEPGDAHNTTVTPSEHENPTMTILIDIQRNCKELNRKFDKLEKSVDDLKKENKKLQEQNRKLTETVNSIATNVSELELTSKQSSYKLDQLEGQSRRQNLNFFNIEESRNETWEESEAKVRDYIKSELKLDESAISIERAHRLPGKNYPRPVFIKFSFFKDKERVIKRYREQRKSDRENKTSDAPSNEASTTDTGSRKRVRVSEDFPERVRKARSFLIPFLKESLEAGKNAYLCFDKLIVNGNSYVYDENKNRPVPSFK